MSERSARSRLLAAQRAWAASVGLRILPGGYLPALEANLLQPMLPETRLDFAEGSGNELVSLQGGASPKMHALHSSSVLACNAFDYWRQRGPGFLGRALGIEGKVSSIRFGRKRPTGLPGSPPNLDVMLTTRSGEVWGIESKFTEPFTHRIARPRLAGAYFPKGARGSSPIWTDRDLPRCGALAAEILSGQVRFSHLDAVQLLKHILGLARYHQGQFTLCYLYFGIPGDEGERHQSEIAEFSEAVEGEVPFHATSYQELIQNLRALAGTHHDGYFRYMGDRYGLTGVGASTPS